MEAVEEAVEEAGSEYLAWDSVHHCMVQEGNVQHVHVYMVMSSCPLKLLVDTLASSKSVLW